MQREQSQKLQFSAMVKEAKSRYDQLEFFSYAEILESSDFTRIDTIALASIRWNKNMNDSLKSAKEKDMSTWLKSVVKKDTVRVNRIN